MSSAGSLCPHCGQTHPTEARVCPNTGQTLTRPLLGVSAPVFIYLVVGMVGILLLGGGLWLWWSETRSAPARPAATPIEAAAAPTVAVLAAQPLATATAQLPATSTVAPSPTALPAPTETLRTTAAPPTVTPAPARRNPTDNAALVYIPAGDSLMGSDAEFDPYIWGAETPMRTVFLDAFWMYQTEVTNVQYTACIQAGACSRPRESRSESREAYFGSPEFDAYPIVQVSWYQAQAYCRWAGANLPTEAQWEKAARSDDGRLFPWGNQFPTGALANLCDENCTNTAARVAGVNDGYSDTAPVGSYPAGQSPYGALDMSGNVWEWVADWFDPGYYAGAPTSNPTGPASGERKVMRGGSWFNGVDGVRTVTRSSRRPDDALYALGFRCSLAP